MRLAIDVDMTYRLGAQRIVLLALEAARTPGQTIVAESVAVEAATVERFAGEGGVGTRLWAHVDGAEMRARYTAEVEVTRPAVDLAGRAAVPWHRLPGDVLTWLRPSRFCQSDEFASYAERRFGDLEGGAKIAAIRDWVAREIIYLPASSHTGTTVLDTFARREGVCRDYAHMVCALARAAGIPARYASVYGLGVDPQDFHAVAQVWLDDGWHLVDATGMCTPDGLVLIGVGRDAFDAPFMETLDDASVVSQTVSVRVAGDKGGEGGP